MKLHKPTMRSFRRDAATGGASSGTIASTSPAAERHAGVGW
jgi:hypothetical protein